MKECVKCPPGHTTVGTGKEAVEDERTGIMIDLLLVLCCSCWLAKFSSPASSHR